MSEYIRWFATLSNKDVVIAGGKNASLGEMIQTLKKEGISVPNGFATTAKAYCLFLEENALSFSISYLLHEWKDHKLSLQKAGKKIRSLILHASFSSSFEKEILEAYKELCQRYHEEVDVAVRSSATAEDLPTASFAGQQDTYLNVHGEKALLLACKKCYASLFTDRAIVYREEKGFNHLKVALSIGIQKMVRSDLAGSGVLFTLDTETGFRKVVVINAAFGLGENVVQGLINPDEYIVFKPLLNTASPILEKTLGKKEYRMIYKKNGTKNIKATKEEERSFVLTDEEILTLAKWGVKIEEHYQRPMDIEWAKDGISKELYIVQARPETVESQKIPHVFKNYTLKEKGKVLLTGLAIGQAITTGEVQIIKHPKEQNRFKKGSILVTSQTTPDWVPIMKMASGIITDHGGRTSHAAIVSRELGVPAIVGTEKATSILKGDITLSCAEGEEGFIYEGILPFETKEADLQNLPSVKTRIMINIASPQAAFHWWPLPCKGIGLARMEFIITNMIKIHPLALIHFEKVDKESRKKIELLTQGYPSKEEYFIDILSKSLAMIASSQYPEPVIVRFSDFKTNEYADLIGGQPFEPKEENPMLGFRGACRYYSPKYREGFALECKALLRAREKLGLTNLIVMIPFCRTLKEADLVLQEMAKNGLNRGEKGLEIYVMCEIPSNVLLAEEFADRFDGFSIGSNDLTQLTLGIDRDAAELASLFDERNEAVKKLIREVIQKAHSKNRKVGICGQAPSDYPEFAEFLVKEGIDSISLNPDSVLTMLPRIAEIEKTSSKN